MSEAMDTLTGLPTRAVFERHKRAFLERAPDERWTMLVIDVDHFKLINDVHGHLIGDQVLRMVADILRENERHTDVVFRYGGDEFVCLFPATEMARGLNFAERVMEHVKDGPNTAVRAPAFPRGIAVSLSMGIAESETDDTSLEALFERADRALYHAKFNGRGRIGFPSESLPEGENVAAGFHHFIGRQPELRQLRQLLDEAIAGGARLAIIEGEAGIGKSRLAQELLHYARFRQCIDLAGECYEVGSQEPYMVIVRGLEREVHGLPEADRQHVLEVAGPICPATAELFPRLPLATSGDVTFFREERLQFRIFDDIARLARGLSELQPLLVLIDDLQWMSRLDTELFAYMVRALQPARTLFLATKRIGSDEAPHVESQLVALRRQVPVLRIKLQRLEEAEAANLVMFALKDPNVPPDALRRMHTFSGGNPFLLRELLISLCGDGSVTRAPSGELSIHLARDPELPDSLSDLMAIRLRPLAPEVRRALRIAAISSQPFTAEAIACVLDEPATHLLELLESPRRLGLVEELIQGPTPGYRFSHDILRSFLQRELSDGIRASYHARLAGYFEHRLAAGVEEAVLQLAHHALGSGDRETARRTALMAARFADKRRAYQESVPWLETYLELLTDPAAEREGALFAYRTLGERRARLGRGEEADGCFERALELAASDSERAQVHKLRAMNQQRMSRYQQAREALHMAASLSSGELALAEIALDEAFIDYVEGQYSEALARLARIERVVARLGEERHHAQYMSTMAILLQATDPTRDPYEYCERALAIYRKHGDLLSEAVVLNNLSTVYSRRGDYPNAIDALRKAEATVARLGDALTQTILLFNLGETYAELGQVTVAREHYHRYREQSERIKNALGAGYAAWGLGQLAERQDDLATATTHYRDASATFARLGGELLAVDSGLNLAQALLLAERHDEAEAELARATQLAERLTPELRAKLDVARALGVATRADDVSENELAAAEQQLRSAIKSCPHIGLFDMMKQYYWLEEVVRRRGAAEDESHRRIVEQASAYLRERLAFVKDPGVRRAMLAHRYSARFASTDED